MGPSDVPYSLCLVLSVSLFLFFSGWSAWYPCLRPCLGLSVDHATSTLAPSAVFECCGTAPRVRREPPVLGSRLAPCLLSLWEQPALAAAWHCYALSTLLQDEHYGKETFLSIGSQYFHSCPFSSVAGNSKHSALAQIQFSGTSTPFHLLTPASEPLPCQPISPTLPGGNRILPHHR